LNDSDKNAEEWLFNVMTPLGISVHTTPQYWEYIRTIKHPTMRGALDLVILTLQHPDQIRQSRFDVNVFLFYRSVGEVRWVCAVVKAENGTGFLISAYPTDKIKRGNLIWKK